MRRRFRVQFLALLASAPLVLAQAACDDSNEALVPGTPIGAETVTITASDYQFSPSTITATAGNAITIVLQNQGAEPHNIAFALPDGDVALDDDLSPGESGSMTLPVPRTPGSYGFYCPVSGHADLGMTGTLIVNATATTTPGETDGTDTGTGPGPGTGTGDGTTPTPEPGPGPNY